MPATLGSGNRGNAATVRFDQDRYEAAKDKLGVSEAEIARRAGIDRTTLHRWRNGIVSPGLDGAASLAAVLGLAVDELFPSAA